MLSYPYRIERYYANFKNKVSEKVLVKNTKNNQSRTVAEDNINQRRPNKRQKNSRNPLLGVILK